MSEQQSNIAPLRSIDEMIHLIHKKWEQGDGVMQKARSLRLETGRLLLELKQRIESGEVGELATWWEWYGDHFARSRSDAEKLIAMASADDPQAAYDAARERDRRDHQNYRDRQRQQQQALSDVRGKDPEAKPTPSLTVVDGGFQTVVKAMADPGLELPELDRPRIEAWIKEFQSFNRLERLFAVKRLRQVYRD